MVNDFIEREIIIFFMQQVFTMKGKLCILIVEDMWGRTIEGWIVAREWIVRMKKLFWGSCLEWSAGSTHVPYKSQRSFSDGLHLLKLLWCYGYQFNNRKRSNNRICSKRSHHPDSHYHTNIRNRPSNWDHPHNQHQLIETYYPNNQTRPINKNQSRNQQPTAVVTSSTYHC